MAKGVYTFFGYTLIVNVSCPSTMLLSSAPRNERPFFNDTPGVSVYLLNEADLCKMKSLRQGHGLDFFEYHIRAGGIARMHQCEMRNMYPWLIDNSLKHQFP